LVEEDKRRRGRNIALAWFLAALALLFFLATIVKMQSGG
jgi:predicted nucleic acid-binding Zn ribbon protein